ncbi:MAG TPA: inositol monophosphatase family protein [Rhodanobacteraceae bacterium]|jgi:myo-inositol-1(or 4)-monophosphatase|nr:inositol monophosphatase family protein [Rhodanobacteraceae bacterium]
MARPIVTVAIRAARAAGSVILRYMNRLDSVTVMEKHHLDFVSDVDREAEATIVRELRRAYPDHAILGEETGASGKAGARYTWAVDPLDGTHNYLRGIPHFAVSIAQLDRGEPIHGVILDPLRNEIYTASKGDGAFLNDRRLRIDKRESLDGAMLATGFPYRERQHLDAQLGMTRELLKRAEDIRRTGSAALDLAWTAAGRVDGYFETGLKIWDMAAGCLLVREAGGRYCNMAGVDGLPESGNLVAANHVLAGQIVEAIGPSLTSELKR